MNWTIIILVGTQALYTVTDLMGRLYMRKYGFTLTAFISLWYGMYILLKIIASFGQLYVFTSTELGKSMALFGAVSIILSNVLGYLILSEILSLGAYIGITLAVLAFIVLAII
ncbi:MAG: hypothetical protein A2539_07755 [Elusimicrobia bacterium RIFOXYD2_FULL_34_15]|nr:MAG: hypothetical protein A2539_07755 [Elusimicrobia bacterium RIFOXYD2_FULL_34_15]